jgi:septum site-determining protein MinD
LGELIAVLSGKGGTGKTSLCAGIATALAQAGESVLCIDCDIGLRNLDIALAMTDTGTLSFLEVCREEYDFAQIPRHPVYKQLAFLTAPVNCLSDQIDPQAFANLLRRARAHSKYVFLDAPAGVDTGFRLAAAKADRILLVTGSDPAAIRDAGRTGQLLELMEKTNVRLVVNRINPKLVSSMDLTIDDVMDGTGLPLLGVIPEDIQVTLAAAVGSPLLKYKPRCAAAKACRRIANRIQGLPEQITLR